MPSITTRHAKSTSYNLSRRKLLKSIIDNKYLLLMFLPGFAYFIIFKYIPMYGITLAFKSFSPLKGIAGSPWAGLKFFDMVIHSQDFWHVFANTLMLSLYNIFFYFPIPIILALMLNEVKSNIFKRVSQTMIYIPYFVSWVITAGLVIEFLSPESGFINYIIELLGGKSHYFMSDPVYFRPIAVLSQIWKYAGWGTIIYLAALAGVNVEMYEAATIDGATKLQKIVYVTLPSILNVIVMMFILKIGFMLNADFELSMNLTNPLTLGVGEIIDTYIYRVGILSSSKDMFSFTTAVGLFKSIMGLILIIMTNRLANRATDGDARLW